MAKTYTFSGSVTGEAASLFSQFGKGTCFNFGFSEVYSKEDSDTVVIDSTDLSPFVLDQDVVPQAHILALQVLDKVSIKVLVTSAGGTDQAFNVSSSLLWHAPLPGDVITEVKLIGKANVEYFLAG